MSNESMYHEGMRKLQDQRDSRRLADRLEELIVHSTFNDDDKAFIQQCAMVFVATSDTEGYPDCSYKGGLPGFVKVIDDQTLAIPDYDGNGMYRSWGNVLVNPHVGLLFIDFEEQKRLRVNGFATISDDDKLLSEFPGSVFVVRIKAEKIFPACPRYIHKMKVVSHSEFSPKENCKPPIPEWKRYDEFNDALPVRDLVEIANEDKK